jgi:P27 family predicted phage terminase small subunit
VGKGRPPKPTHLRLLNGNAGKRPINKAEPKPAKKRPEQPAGLDAGAARAWTKISDVLEGMGVLTIADGVALHLLVDALTEWQQARGVTERDGATYECPTESGGVMIRARPEVAIAADAWRRAKAMLTEFGLTPSSRTRIKTGGKQAEDEMAEFLFGPKGPGGSKAP